MPQDLPYNAAEYDGVTKKFDWDTEEGRDIQGRFGRALDALTRVRRAAKTETDSTAGIHGATEEILARGLELKINLPPFPLPGELASLELQDLAIAMAVALAHDEWNQTPLDLTPWGIPAEVVPATVMWRIA